jgi:hypothetical protein
MLRIIPSRKRRPARMNFGNRIFPERMAYIVRIRRIHPNTRMDKTASIVSSPISVITGMYG